MAKPSKKKDKIDYGKRLEEISPYSDFRFKATKKFTSSQKGQITKEWKRLRPFIGKKSEKGDYQYKFLEGAFSITADKAFKTNKGAFVQIPRRSKGKVSKHIIKKGQNEIAKIDYTNGKTGRAKRRDFIVAVDAKKMVKEPEKYLDQIRKELGLSKRDVLGVHLLFKGFQNRNRYSLGYFVRYLSEPTERFDKLKRSRKINEVITGIKLVTVRRSPKKKKKGTKKK
jgi:hypothetical protein